MGKYLRCLDIRIEEYGCNGEEVNVEGLKTIIHDIKFYVGKIFEYHFNHDFKVQTDGISKVNIILSPHDYDDRKYIKLIDIINIYRYFKIESYMALSDHDKRSYCLDMINDSLMFVFENKPVIQSEIESVYRRIHDDGCVLRAVWKKPVSSPDKTMTAQIYFELHETLDQYLRIKGELDYDRLLWRMRPRSIDFGLLSWSGNASVLLYEIGLDRLYREDEANKRDYWIYRTDNVLLSFYFHRAESGQAHGQYELGKMYLNGWDKHSPDLKMAKYWLGKSARQGYSRAVKLIESLI